MTDQPNYCDRVPGVPHTAADHDACERRRIDTARCVRDGVHYMTSRHPHIDCPTYVPDPPKTVTVSGNGLTVHRLDEQGNPVGEGLSLNTAVTLNFPSSVEDDVLLNMNWRAKTFTIDMDLVDVDPNLIALLTGGALPPYEVWGSTRLYRWLPRFIQRRVKSRWIRRAYSG